MRNWLCVKRENFQPAPLSNKRVGFFSFCSVFSRVDAEEHTEDSPLAYTGGLHCDQLICRKNTSQLQEREKSGIQACVHPGTEFHNGAYSHSFSMLSCAAPVSQSSQLELEAMEHLF